MSMINPTIATAANLQTSAPVAEEAAAPVYVFTVGLVVVPYHCVQLSVAPALPLTVPLAALPVLDAPAADTPVDQTTHDAESTESDLEFALDVVCGLGCTATVVTG